MLLNEDSCNWIVSSQFFITVKNKKINKNVVVHKLKKCVTTKEYDFLKSTYHPLPTTIIVRHMKSLQYDFLLKFKCFELYIIMYYVTYPNVSCTQCVDGGYQYFAGRKLVTVFSAPDYNGYGLPGAVMSVSKHFECTFQLIPVVAATHKRQISVRRTASKKPKSC